EETEYLPPRATPSLDGHRGQFNRQPGHGALPQNRTRMRADPCRNIERHGCRQGRSRNLSAVSTCAFTPTGRTASLTSNAGEWFGGEVAGSTPSALAPRW